MVTRIPQLPPDSSAAGIDLLWIPLGAGAGGRVVRASGRAYEALVARRQHRPPQPLFHAALRGRLAGAG